MKCVRFTAAAVFFFWVATFSLFSDESKPTGPFDSEATDFAVWGPTCPSDALTPDAGQIEAVHAWEKSVFGGEKESFEATDGVSLERIRQDYNLLRFNESCMGNRLKIGSVDFDSGLGTHAGSEIVARFPKPVTKFSAAVGIDNNSSTRGVNGSAVFVVEAAGREIYRSEKLTGASEPEKIDVSFEPTDALTLKVEPTDDGPAHDQADWCAATSATDDGTVFSLSDSHTPLLQTGRYPFEFLYDGKSSDELLPTWKFESSATDALNTVYRWTDPATGLLVEVFVRRFEKFAAIEWLLTFKNTGKNDTPILSQVKTARTDFSLGLERTPIVVHTLRGDFCDESSWLPQEFELQNGEEKAFAPAGGRPSNLVMPFWNLTRQKCGGRERSEGIFATIGWSGQWSAAFKKTDEYHASLVAGQEEIATVLRPNEAIRQPRILLMPWHGEKMDSHVLWRRLLMFEYAPKWAASPNAPSKLKPQPLEIFGQCFDRYYRKRDGWEKYDQQVEFARRLAEAGCTSYWFDAAWFPVGFPNGVGNWFSDKENFPDGLEALGKAVHDLGLKFTLWFEPERVAPDTDIAKNHSEFVFGGENGGLYKLSDPAAEAYLTDLLSTRIKEYGVNIYRNDFNIDPLGFWRAADAENRRGMTEIRYIEAHYRMWDTLRARFPGLWVDNCASGGRRIDLETVSRSISLWRSDTCCWPGHPEWDQIQSLSIAQFIPIFASVAWDSSPYTFRSAACPGAILQYNFLDDDYDSQAAKQSINEAKVYQKFWYGDFYPLTDAALGKRSIIAWQCDRSDLGAGIVYLFRQSDSPYLGINLRLKALDPTAMYTVRIKSGYDVDETKTLTGAELADYPLMISEKQSAVVVEYERINQ